MISKRYQDSWKVPATNASLMVNPSQSQVENVYTFCEHFQDHLATFVFTSMNISKLFKLEEHPLLVDTQQNLSMIVEILKQQKFIFIDVFSEVRASYKGYVSWLLIGTHSRLYLIDSARLHDDCYKLKEVLERKELIKFMHECQEVVFALKRDWEMFLPNIFDIEVVQRYWAKKGKTSNCRSALKQFLSSPQNIINNRPIKPSIMSKLQEYYYSQISLMHQLDKFFAQSDPSYEYYAYFNHYQFLLKSYYHHVPTVRERDEMERARRGINSFAKYASHQQVNSDTVKQKQSQFWHKDAEEQEIAVMICEWIEHIAKMKDVSPEEILPYETVSKLAKTKLNSILKISELCSHTHTSTVYSLSLQDFQQIFELFQLYKQQKEQSTHSLVIPRRLPYFKYNEQKPIKELFQQVKFTDVGNDWLNKKNDQSVRLYKEIISINQFDNSIAEDYMKESAFSGEDVSRYVKYAECLRLGNHNRLQELYEKTKPQQNCAIQSCEEEYFEENFIEGEQYKNWDEIEEEINFPTMDTINQPKSNQSLTSLKSISNLGVQSCKHFSNNVRSTIVLKQKQLNSLRLLESPSIFSKIEPLPQNIEAIYLEAAKAKKGYVSKGQKKTTKALKKQSKTKIEASSKKEEQFVPKKEQIFNLIYY